MISLLLVILLLWLLVLILNFFSLCSTNLLGSIGLNSHVNLCSLNMLLWILHNNSSLSIICKSFGSIVVLISLSFTIFLSLHHVLDLSLCYLQELFSLKSCLDLYLGCNWVLILRTNWLDSRSGFRILLISTLGCIQKHSDSCKSHKYILNILVVLMLSHQLLSQLQLLLKESLLILSIGVVVVSVNRSTSKSYRFTGAILWSNFQIVADSLESFSSYLHFLFLSSSLPSNHSLLIFLGQVFFIGDALVEFIPLVVLATLEHFSS